MRWQFWLCSFGLSRLVDWLVEANHSEKRAVSILRVEVIIRDSEGPYICIHTQRHEGKCEGKGQSGQVRADGWRWRLHAPSKLWLLPIRPHGALNQKNITMIITAVFVITKSYCIFTFSEAIWTSEQLDWSTDGPDVRTAACLASTADKSIFFTCSEHCRGICKQTAILIFYQARP
jgi:hypothetical protein